MGGPAIALANPGAAPGEQFTFKLSMGPIVGGRARMSIGSVKYAGKSGNMLSVRAQAEGAPWVQLVAKMQDDYSLVVDPQSLLPLEVIEIEHGGNERRIQVTITSRNVEIDLQMHKTKQHLKRVMPTEVHDPLSAYFAIRALALNEGERITLDILDGNSLWRSTVVVSHIKKLMLDENGPNPRAVPAILLSGTSTRIDDTGKPMPVPPRKARIWLSEDSLRTLLRLEADTKLGLAALELTSYEATASARKKIGSGTLAKVPGVTVMSSDQLPHWDRP